MIIDTAPQNEAVISNVQGISAFNIKATAKSFAILSSGLYANKVRAIVRELSCNAYDSHIAAGNADTPFDLHIPTKFEPWFAIRDYGTGLTQDQVVNIYTTYFESTKTNSNDFIGALGLGSKSPFSYTDNFTVTAIKDGICGMYSAFINEHGIPSIALMSTENTDQPNGVEVKFAVDSYYDFNSFSTEANNVLQHFKTKPNLTGAKFNYTQISYVDRDIVPGVHLRARGYYNMSYAVMGNIEYPIQIPASNSSLGSLRELLAHNLEIHFDIGQLDFQASREGLSYIPMTIEAIKAKLVLLQDKLYSKIKDEAEAIPNYWDRCEYVKDRYAIGLYKISVIKYAKDHFDVINSHGIINPIKIPSEDIANKYNIHVRGYHKSHSKATIKLINRVYNHEIDPETKKPVNIPCDEFYIGESNYFVINEGGKRSVVTGTKEHFTTSKIFGYSVYILDQVDKTKPMMIKEFFNEVKNPPESRIIYDSSFPAKEKKVKSVAIKLKNQIKKYYKPGWSDVSFDSVDDSSKTFYYVELHNKVPHLSKSGSLHDIYEFVTKNKIIPSTDLYGINKSSLDIIKGMKNWVSFESLLEEKLPLISDEMIERFARSQVHAPYFMLVFSKNNISKIKDPNSLFVEYSNIVNNRPNSVEPGYIFDYSDIVKQKYEKAKKMLYNKATEFGAKYPILKHLNSSYYDEEERNVQIVEYVNLMDSLKQTA